MAAKAALKRPRDGAAAAPSPTPPTKKPKTRESLPKKAAAPVPATNRAPRPRKSSARNAANDVPADSSDSDATSASSGSSDDSDDGQQNHDHDSAALNSKQTLSKEDRMARKREIRQARRGATGKSGSESQPAPTTAARVTPARPYLTYLDTFHNDKANWKFNKALQSSLLKDIFDTNKVAPSFNPALRAYVGGLQGQAAIQRLMDGAKQTLAKTPGPDGQILDMENASDRQKAFEAAAAADAEKVRHGADVLDDQHMRDAYHLNDATSAEAIKEAADAWRRATLVYASTHDLLNEHIIKKRAEGEPQPPKVVKTTVKEVYPQGKQTTNEAQKATKKRSRGRKRRTLDQDVEVSSDSE